MPAPSASTGARFGVSYLGDASAAPAEAVAAWSMTARRLAGVDRVRLGIKRSSGRLEYPASHERDLTDSLPRTPAAVRVYGDDGCCRTLFLDFDAKGIHSPADAARDESYVRHLLDVIGIRYITDVAPTGGRHLYIPLAERMPLDSARDIVEGLAVRFKTLDPGPHRSAMSGCVRTPGSVHGQGGHQSLTMPLWRVQDVLDNPNTADEVEELRAAIAGDVDIARQRRLAAAVEPLEVDVPSAGPVRPLSARLLMIAREGVWDTERYGQDRSAARQAVVTGCAAAGWTVTDIYQRIADGTWPGLAAMYAKYRYPAARLKAIRADMLNAQRYLALVGNSQVDGGNRSVRNSNTSARLSRRGSDPHGDIRTWRAVLATTERHRLPGRSWYAARFVLRALGEAAHKTGSLRVSFGCRSLAEASGLDHSTVSVLLHRLAKEGWITRVARGWGENADTWELSLPEDLAEDASTYRWPHGKIHALRPAFRSLGHVCALVFEAVEIGKAHTVLDLSRFLGMSRSNVHEAVEMLLGWKLFERIDGRLEARPERLMQVAEYLGADEALYEQMMRHRRQRALWRAWLARFETDEYAEAMGLSDGWFASPRSSEIEAA